MTTENDPVHRPAHYANSSIEVANFIADRKMDYFLGNVVKYISRAGIKNPETELEDLEKAQAYLAMRIRMVKGDEPISRVEENLRSMYKEVVPVAPSRDGHDLTIHPTVGVVYLTNIQTSELRATEPGSWMITNGRDVDIRVEAQPVMGYMFVNHPEREWSFAFKAQDSQTL